jgi:formylmethanofuran dehydrogenase subunit E
MKFTFITELIFNRFEVNKSTRKGTLIILETETKCFPDAVEPQTHIEGN